MDPLATIALTVVLAAAGFYVLYLVVRSAVAGGIRDASKRQRAEEQASAIRRE